MGWSGDVHTIATAFSKTDSVHSHVAAVVTASHHALLINDNANPSPRPAGAHQGPRARAFAYGIGKANMASLAATNKTVAAGKTRDGRSNEETMIPGRLGMVAFILLLRVVDGAR